MELLQRCGIFYISFHYSTVCLYFSLGCNSVPFPVSSFPGCRLTSDCQGMECCVGFDFITGTRNVNVLAKLTQCDTMSCGIERKAWSKSGLDSLTGKHEYYNSWLKNNLIKISCYNSLHSSLTSDSIELEVMSRWTHCQPIKTPLTKFYHHFSWDTFLSSHHISRALWHFSYIMVVSFIGRGNRRTRRKPQTCRKSLTNFFT